MCFVAANLVFPSPVTHKVTYVGIGLRMLGQTPAQGRKRDAANGVERANDSHRRCLFERAKAQLFQIESMPKRPSRLA
jgi:hypothetical protein